MKIEFKNIERQQTFIDEIEVIIDGEIKGKIETRTFESNGFVYWVTDSTLTKFMGLDKFYCFESRKKAKKYIMRKLNNITIAIVSVSGGK